MSVVKVDNLSKSYTISHKSNERYVALRDVIANKAKGMFNRGIVQPFKRLANSTVQQFNSSPVQQQRSSSPSKMFPSKLNRESGLESLVATELAKPLY
jgi:hypothetical protein